MDDHTQPTHFQGTPTALFLELRYPLKYLLPLTRGREDGWQIRYSEPWLELWRNDALHGYSLRIEVDESTESFFFPEAWVSPTWWTWTQDVQRHRRLLVDLLDEAVGCRSHFDAECVSGDRHIDEVVFSGKVRTIEEVDSVYVTLRNEVLRVLEGRDWLRNGKEGHRG